jgi:hypothetical protein
LSKQKIQKHEKLPKLQDIRPFRNRYALPSLQEALPGNDIQVFLAEKPSSARKLRKFPDDLETTFFAALPEILFMDPVNHLCQSQAPAAAKATPPPRAGHFVPGAVASPSEAGTPYKKILLNQHRQPPQSYVPYNAARGVGRR